MNNIHKFRGDVSEATFSDPQLEKEYLQLKKSSKGALVDIYMRSHRVADEGEVKRTSKGHLVFDIMRDKFGSKKVKDNMNEANTPSIKENNMSKDFNEFRTEINEVYAKSSGFKLTHNAIVLLTKQLRPGSNLEKSISRDADNVKNEFAQMKKHMDAIEDLWDEVAYIIENSNQDL